MKYELIDDSQLVIDNKMHLSLTRFLLFLVLCTSQLSICGQLYNQFYKEIAVNGIMYPGGQLGVIKYGNNESCVAKGSMSYTGLWDFSEIFCHFKKERFVDDIRYIVIRPLSSEFPCKIANDDNLIPTESYLFEQINNMFRVVPVLTCICMFLLILYDTVRRFQESSKEVGMLLLLSFIFYTVSKLLLLVLIALTHSYSNKNYYSSGDTLPKSLMDKQKLSYGLLYTQVIIELCVFFYAAKCCLFDTKTEKNQSEFSENLMT